MSLTSTVLSDRSTNSLLAKFVQINPISQNTVFKPSPKLSLYTSLFIAVIDNTDKPFTVGAVDLDYNILFIETLIVVPI